MKVLAAILVTLVVALQYPLWFGKGGWMRVRELEKNLAMQQEATARLKARNDALDAEVRDLKEGNEAIEERARIDLGMIKRDETFYQVVAGETASRPLPAPGSDRALPRTSSRGEK